MFFFKLKFPSIPIFSMRFKYCEWMLNLTIFSAWSDRLMWLFISLLHMVRVDFTIQNWIRFPRITPSLAMASNPSICYILLWVCMSTFIQEYGFFYSRILCLILSFFILPCGRKKSTFASSSCSRGPAVFLVWDMLEIKPRASHMFQPPMDI